MRNLASFAAPLRIVAIGGGTGLATLLEGLKRNVDPVGPGRRGRVKSSFPPAEITAVVTVTDDGGSSGRLRREFDVLPPGDIRNCLVALSEDEALLGRLFQHRFSSGRGLKGHSFGNLFLTALTDLTGDFARAVKLSSEVLATRGKIYPSTAANVMLEARLASGAVVVGETRISRSRSPIESIALRPRRAKPLKETLEAIASADLITLGPGSLFTSVIPNLLVEGIPEAIRRSPAVKAYFVNLMWQPGETMQFSASDHVAALYRHGLKGALDCVVVNTEPVAAPLRRKYARELAQPVENDMARLSKMRVTIITRDLLARSDKARHDPEAVARVTIELAVAGRRRRLRTGG